MASPTPEERAALPCPWCGAKVVLDYRLGDDGTFGVECPKCKARGPARCLLPETAIRSWNRVAAIREAEADAWRRGAEAMREACARDLGEIAAWASARALCTPLPSPPTAPTASKQST